MSTDRPTTFLTSGTCEAVQAPTKPAGRVRRNSAGTKLENIPCGPRKAHSHPRTESAGSRASTRRRLLGRRNRSLGLDMSNSKYKSAESGIAPKNASGPFQSRPPPPSRKLGKPESPTAGGGAAPVAAYPSPPSKTTRVAHIRHLLANVGGNLRLYGTITRSARGAA